MSLILITGSTGQLGHALQSLCTARGIVHKAVSRPLFDLAKPETITSCFNAAKPSLVINAAAYTAVDAAQSDKAAAAAANHTGPLHLAQLCAANAVPLIHISTDYVFDGTKGAPYTESDATCPASVYGASKRDGEIAILQTASQAIILRTAWVYAAHGKNFARTMLNAARKTSQLRVVADQYGTPTAAPDLAAAILAIATQLAATGWRPEYRGIFHATNMGETTWYGFAQEIFKAANAALQLTPITTADWPTPAKRPADSRLDCSKLAEIFNITLPPWQNSVPPIVAQLLIMDKPD